MGFTKEIQLLFVVLFCCAIMFCNSLTGSGSNNTTGPTLTVTDIDGNVYQTLKIGNQEWMAENLRTTKYNDGTPITFDTSNERWSNATTEKYCYYNNTTNSDSIRKYGALYNAYVVSPANPKKIAPIEWHVPTDAEWSILENYLIANGHNWDGTTTGNKIAKAMAARTDWGEFLNPGAIGNDLTINNSSGFSAFPSGWRDGNGDFECRHALSYWFSATEGDSVLIWYRGLSFGSDNLSRSTGYKKCGRSVRLIKD